jgi:hypothetical protein
MHRCSKKPTNHATRCALPLTMDPMVDATAPWSTRPQIVSTNMRSLPDLVLLSNDASREQSSD